MFRIEAFPHTSSVIAQSQPQCATDAPSSSLLPSKYATQTLHTCLATSLNEMKAHLSNNSAELDAESGTAFTVGRKNATISFESDKCVSRKHSVVRMVVHPSYLDSLAAQPEYSFATKEQLHEWYAPRTKEEEEACSSSNNNNQGQGVALIVQDMGSKFGTFLMEPVTQPAIPTRTQEEDNDDTDDEEAPMSLRAPSQMNPDASQSSQPLPKQQFNLQRHDDTREMVHLVGRTKLQPNQPLPLSFSTSPSSIWVQCGVSGSLVRITLLPQMVLCISSLSAEIQSTFTPLRLSTIGATVVSVWSNDCTHLVASESRVTTKRLCAWVCHKPLCTPEYVVALLDRPDCTSRLPSPNDFEGPTFSSSSASLMRDSTDAHRTLFRRFTFLVYHHVKEQLELIPLCEAAGAMVVPVFQNSEIEDKDEYIVKLKEQSEQEGKMLVATDAISSSSSGKKLSTEAKQWKKILQKCGVPFTDARIIADCILRGKTLEDRGGNVIGNVGGGNGTEKKTK